MAGSRMNKRLFLLLFIFIIFCCIGWLRLIFILMSYELEPRPIPVSQLATFSNKVARTHDWYHSYCFGGIENELSASTLDDFIEKWRVTYSPRECSDVYSTFSSIYSVNRRSGQLIIPETFQTKLLKWLGNDEELLKEAKLQFITSIYNKYTHEHTMLNTLRAKRPGVNNLDDAEYLEELMKNSQKNCDFCDYKYKTAEDTFGRIESKHCATAANAFKIEGFHSLVILKTHDARILSEEQFLDVMEVSMKWYMKVYDTDKQYRYPHLIWDNLPKASCSQVHPHAQILLGPVRHYGGIEHYRLAAITYGQKHQGRNYFTDLMKIHNALGLTINLGNASALAYLNPKKDNDVMIISKTPCPDFFRLVYFTIRTFLDLKLYAWSMAMFLPKLEPWSTPNYDDIPAIARIVTRGPASSTRSDIGAMELFSINNVNMDPFTVIRNIKKSVDAHGHPHNALQGVEAKKHEIQQQILELQQKEIELEQKVQQQQELAPGEGERALQPPQPHLQPVAVGDQLDEHLGLPGKETNQGEEGKPLDAQRGQGVLVEEIDNKVS